MLIIAKCYVKMITEENQENKRYNKVLHWIAMRPLSYVIRNKKQDAMRVLCFSDYGYLVFRQTIQPNGHALCIEFNITGEYLGNLICGQLAAEHLRLHDDVVAQGFF